jgi:Protein of unknown function (DUF3105)
MVLGVYRRRDGRAGPRSAYSLVTGKDERMPRRTARLALVLVVAGLVPGLVAGCGGSSHPAPPAATGTTGCGPAFQEHLDPRSTIHLFPGAAEPTYLSDPPTSGPHQLGQPPTGAVTAPIPRARQVAMLESGFVLVQYRALSPAEVASLAGLAGSLVTVAPAVGSLPARVVATAWTWKQVCPSAGPDAVAALRAFIAARRGKGFSHS